MIQPSTRRYCLAVQSAAIIGPDAGMAGMPLVQHVPLRDLSIRQAVLMHCRAVGVAMDHLCRSLPLQVRQHRLRSRLRAR